VCRLDKDKELCPEAAAALIEFKHTALSGSASSKGFAFEDVVISRLMQMLNLTVGHLTELLHPKQLQLSQIFASRPLLITEIVIPTSFKPPSGAKPRSGLPEVQFLELKPPGVALKPSFQHGAGGCKFQTRVTHLLPFLRYSRVPATRSAVLCWLQALQ
jgi:hypothetical protein